MEIAKKTEIKEVFDFYQTIVEYMNTKGLRIGWNIDKYPNLEFVENMISSGDMLIVRKNGNIVCAAAINHNVNPEYNDIDWDIKGPAENISSIHALAVSPDCRGQGFSDKFLLEIEEYCRNRGDLAIHFDVIDINTPAYDLYIRNGYTDKAKIEMYYEVVGYKYFHMIEKVL